MKKLMNISEASLMLGISKPTLYRYVYLRRIPFVKYNRRVLFDAERLEAFIAEHSIEPVTNKKSSSLKD